MSVELENFVAFVVIKKYVAISVAVGGGKFNRRVSGQILSASAKFDPNNSNLKKMKPDAFLSKIEQIKNNENREEGLWR